jgi:Zn-dependent peptidase ImmA (M78 family)
MAIVRKKTDQPTVATAARLTARELVARLTAANLMRLPLNVRGVAEYLGLEVVEEPMDDDMSGFLEIRSGRWVVGVNAFHHVNRKRFTIAHEIAHFLLHSDGQAVFRDRTFARRASDPSQMEREADQFAAELLMPADDVRQHIASGVTSLSALASQFGVSALAMKYRVQKLGYQVNQ